MKIDTAGQVFDAARGGIIAHYVAVAFPQAPERQQALAGVEGGA